MTDSIHIPFGKKQQLSLDTERAPSVIGMPSGDGIKDVVAAVAEALIEPIDYPSLALAVVPGDLVAVTVDRELPQAPAVVGGVIKTLLDSGVLPKNITLVVADKSDLLPVERGLPDDVRTEIRMLWHDPTDKNELAYLAASADGDPIYVNRMACDADLVIPLSRVAVDPLTGEPICRGVFPSFADIGTQRRLADSTQSAAVQKRGKRELEEATWLLGSRLTVQVVAGAGESVLQVLAGDVDSVQPKVATIATATWKVPVADQADLVVAMVPGGESTQTWRNVARALTAASRIVNDDGAVAICSELSESIGPAMMQIIGAANLDEAETLIAEGEFADSHVARQIIAVLHRHKIYLLSKMSESQISDLGMAYVNDANEIKNLCNRHASCIVLANAQHAWPTLEESRETSKL